MPLIAGLPGPLVQGLAQRLAQGLSGSGVLYCRAHTAVLSGSAVHFCKAHTAGRRGRMQPTGHVPSTGGICIAGLLWTACLSGTLVWPLLYFYAWMVCCGYNQPSPQQLLLVWLDCERLIGLCVQSIVCAACATSEPSAMMLCLVSKSGRCIGATDAINE